MIISKIFTTLVTDDGRVRVRVTFWHVRETCQS